MKSFEEWIMEVLSDLHASKKTPFYPAVIGSTHGILPSDKLQEYIKLAIQR